MIQKIMLYKSSFAYYLNIIQSINGKKLLNKKNMLYRERKRETGRERERENV